MLRSFLCLCMLTLLQMTNTAQAAVSASLDRNTVFEGDTVLLQIVLDEQSSDDPDLSVLREDFEILGSSSSTQMSLTNGVRSVNTRWSIQLEPKKLGDLIVPSIQLGAERTQPLRLSVLEREAIPGAGQEVFVEMEATPRDPYVQSEVAVVIRLYHALPLTEGALENPAPEPAVVQKLGDDSSYRTTLNGRNYRVIERKFSIFPERSGEMVIPAVAFDGRVSDNSRQDRFNSIFQRGRRIREASDSITLNVRPQPTDFSGASWLPAKNLTLQESWPEADNFKVGEPVTRTISLDAKSLLAVQLPELDLPETDQFKVYPDQPQSSTRTDGTTVYGKVEHKYAVVPTVDGRIILPEIRVPWWNTETNSEEVAVIPARELLVQAAQVLPTPVLETTTLPETSVVTESSPYWRWAAIGLMALWLATLLLWRVDRQSRKPARQSKKKQQMPETPTARSAKSSFKQACDSNKPADAASSLLRWAAATNPNQGIVNLSGLAARLEDGNQAQMLRELDRAVYSSSRQEGDSQWHGERLWVAMKGGFKLAKRESQNSTVPGILPPLYPP